MCQEERSIPDEFQSPITGRSSCVGSGSGGGVRGSPDTDQHGQLRRLGGTIETGAFDEVDGDG